MLSAGCTRRQWRGRSGSAHGGSPAQDGGTARAGPGPGQAGRNGPGRAAGASYPRGPHEGHEDATPRGIDLQKGAIGRGAAAALASRGGSRLVGCYDEVIRLDGGGAGVAVAGGSRRGPKHDNK